jgi:hypothetical protein
LYRHFGITPHNLVNNHFFDVIPLTKTIPYQFCIKLITEFMSIRATYIRGVMDFQSVKVELFFCVIIGIKIFWPPADAHSDPLLLNSPYIKKDNLQCYY